MKYDNLTNEEFVAWVEAKAFDAEMKACDDTAAFLWDVIRRFDTYDATVHRAIDVLEEVTI